jgi:hypothetical protein
MFWVGFEPTTQVFEWAKIFHALDSAATVGGVEGITISNFTLMFSY